MSNNIIVSPHCICLINSVPFAKVKGFGWGSSSGRKVTYGIDTMMPTDICPTVLGIRGSMQIYRLHRDGGIEAAGMIPSWRKMTLGKFFSVAILDRTTDTVIFHANRCEVESQSWLIQPKSYVTGNVSFVGLDYENEAS